MDPQERDRARRIMEEADRHAEERDRRLARAEFELWFSWWSDAFFVTLKGLGYAYLLCVAGRSGSFLGVLEVCALAWLLGRFSPVLDKLGAVRHSDTTAVERRHMASQRRRKNPGKLSRADRAAGMKAPGDKRLLKRFGDISLYRRIVRMVNEDEVPYVWDVYLNHAGRTVAVRWRGRRCSLIRAIAKRGISPEVVAGGHPDSYCSIGKSSVDGKWYGWSHLAMHGFGMGDMVFSERFSGRNENTRWSKCGTRPIKNDSDAKLAATRFARSVG